MFTVALWIIGHLLADLRAFGQHSDMPGLKRAARGAVLDPAEPGPARHQGRRRAGNPIELARVGLAALYAVLYSFGLIAGVDAALPAARLPLERATVSPRWGTARFRSPLLASFAFVLGACIGSFLNVVVWRLPRGESLISPALALSRLWRADPGLGERAAAVRTWRCAGAVARAGRTSRCAIRWSRRSPVRCSRRCSWSHGPDARLLVDWALAAALIAVIFIDIDHHIIPNSITLPGLAVGPGPRAVRAAARGRLPRRAPGRARDRRRALGPLRRLRAAARPDRPGHGRREAHGDAGQLPRLCRARLAASS